MMLKIMRACARAYGIVTCVVLQSMDYPVLYYDKLLSCSSFYFEWRFSFYGLSHKSQDSFCHNIKTVSSYNVLLGEQ